MMTAALLDRRSPVLPWLGVAGAFAVGAALTYLLARAVEYLHPAPGPISDDIVLERVRGRIAELVSQPDAISVTVDNGVVRLAGALPLEERDTLLTQLLHMPGVVRLRNALGSNGASSTTTTDGQLDLGHRVPMPGARL